MPIGLVPAIALHEIVEAKSRSPASHTAVRAAEPKFFDYRDLSIVQKEITIVQKTGGTLRASVKRIIWIGEIVEQHRRIRLVRWKTELKRKTVTWTGAAVDAKCVEIIEVRDDDRTLGNVIGTREMLP